MLAIPSWCEHIFLCSFLLARLFHDLHLGCLPYSLHCRGIARGSTCAFWSYGCVFVRNGDCHTYHMEQYFAQTAKCVCFMLGHSGWLVATDFKKPKTTNMRTTYNTATSAGNTDVEETLRVSIYTASKEV